jgi:DNA-binding response OmpR family regulator
LKLLEVKPPLRVESSGSMTLAKSFIEACKSDNVSIFVDALNVWHEREPEVDFEGVGAKHNAVKHEAMAQPESKARERIQSLIQPSQNAGQIVLLGCPSNSAGGRLPLCTVKRAAILVHLILSDVIAHDICKAMESGQPDVPDIVGTHISEVLDKVRSLEPAADGHVTTPLSHSELLIGFERSLIRGENAAAPIAAYTFGDCEIDFAKMTARRAGKPVAVTTLEFRLLKYFLDNAERVLSRAELLDEVWGYNCYPTTRTVDNLILKLRRKLERNPTEPRHLHTVYGAGYKFVP